MASASLVAPTHQVVKLAVGMASTGQIQTVPEGSSLPIGQSTKQKKQPAKNNNGAKKLKRPVSTNTPHPGTSTTAQAETIKGPKRTNSSPVRSSTGSQGAPPASPEKSTLTRKASTPPSTRGTHLKAVQPKHKRSSSLTKAAAGAAAATAIATKDVVVKVTGSKVAEEKELARKASPTGQTRKEGTITRVAAKKKKDATGQPSKRLSASTPNMKQATKEPEKIGGGKQEQPSKRLSASASNIKTANNSAGGAAKQAPKKTSVKIKTVKEQESPGSGKARPSLSAKQQKQASTTIKQGKAKNAPESPTREGKPKLLIKKTSQTGSVAKSPKKARSTSVLSSSSFGAPSATKALSPKRHSFKPFSKQQQHQGGLAPIPDISSELETRLESQRMLDEGYIPKPKSTNDIVNGLPPQRKPEATAVTPASAMALVSSTYGGGSKGKRSSLDSQQLAALSPKPTNKRSSLDSVSAHLSTSASMLMPNQSERIDSRHRRSQDDEEITKTKHHSNKATKIMPLTYFGNPLVPIDIVETSQRMSKLNLMHHKDALRVLGEIKNMKRQQLHVEMEAVTSSLTSSLTTSQNLKLQKKESQPKKKPELKVIQLLKTAGTATSATLTMTGFKVEKVGHSEQVNHDRSLIVSPFYLRNHSNSMVRRRLMGVFDGHAEHGSKFAEHCQQLLPSMLSRKLSEAFKKAVEDIAAGVRTREDEVAITKRVLAESFVSMDESSPREATGGCTATVVYQQGQKVYVANAGDSRSFIAVYRKDQSEHIDDCPHQHHQRAGPTKQSKNTMKFAPAEPAADSRPTCARVVYMSREDKPDLPSERKRLEGWGGEIVPAEKNKSSKVKFYNNRPGKASATLSMSRSIGDWQFTPLGVIPDPLVDVLDLKEMVENEKKKDGESFVDDVCIFAVCVSDGMMIESVGDAEAVASDLASSLFSDDGHYPLCACQSVITKTSAIWDKRNKGKFRDDITIAMTVLRTPGGATSRSRF